MRDASLLNASTAGENATEGAGFSRVPRPASPLRKPARFVPSLAEEAALRDWLHESIQNRAVIAWFQPIVDVRTGSVIGFEALARAWRDGTAVPPGVFIALAQEEGLIDELGEIVLGYALRQAHRLPGDSLSLGLNFTNSQLAQSSLVDRLVQVAERSGFTYDRLVVEVSERELSLADATSAARLELMLGMGFQLVVDDFSARWLSLASIAEMGASGVKISRRVVDVVAENETASTLIRKLCLVAHDNGLHVTSVGVEEAEQMHVLRGLGCDQVQGFFTGRPLPIDDAAAFRDRRSW